jgi:hypothetical protein
MHLKKGALVFNYLGHGGEDGYLKEFGRNLMDKI